MQFREKSPLIHCLFGFLEAMKSLTKAHQSDKSGSCLCFSILLHVFCHQHEAMSQGSQLTLQCCKQDDSCHLISWFPKDIHLVQNPSQFTYLAKIR
jgi:hypothetical protein